MSVGRQACAEFVAEPSAQRDRQPRVSVSAAGMPPPAEKSSRFPLRHRGVARLSR